MSDILQEMRKKLEKRLQDYYKADETHMKEIMNHQLSIDKLKEKRKATDKLIIEVRQELDKLDEYESFIAF